MIPAKNPIVVPATAEIVYDQWTPLRIAIFRDGPGISRVSVVAHASRIVNADGDTELCPTTGPVEVVIPNIYAPATDGVEFVPDPLKSEDENTAARSNHLTHAAVYPATVRAKTLAAAGPLLEAVAALLEARSIR